MALLKSVNTKLEAYKLIHDPTKLLSLLFSKYGDIEDDYNLLYIEQLIYNKSSHYNVLYKEYKYLYLIEENLKRFYNVEESKRRLPKLNEYYKNYHIFFCKPTLRNFHFGEILHNYDDNKAEIFYKKNYCSNQSDNNNKKDTSLSSLDNLTNNKTIFGEKTIIYIEDTNSNKDNITITLESSKILNCNLLSKRSKDDSFRKVIREIVSYNLDKNKKKKKLNIENKKEINYNKNHKITINKNKNSLYSIMKPQYNNINRENTNKNINKIPSEFKHILSNLEEFNKNKIIGKSSNISNFTKLSATLSHSDKTSIKKNSNKYSLKSEIKSKDSFNQTIKNNNNISAGIQSQYSLLIGNILHSKNKTNNKINKKKTQSQNKENKCKKKGKNNTNSNSHNSNYISKFNSNSNFSTFNVNSNFSSNKKITKGSNFNLVKSPISNILKVKENQSSILKEQKVSSLISQKSLLSKTNFHISSSNSLKKNQKKNYNTKYNIFNHFDNNNNIIYSSQRSTSDTSNRNFRNNIKNERIKISRNKLNNIICQTKTFRKNISNKLSSNHTRSVEEFKKINNIHNSQRLKSVNENKKKVQKVLVRKKPLKNKTWNKTIDIDSTHNNKKININIKNNISKPIIEKSIKLINVNLNKNLLLSAEKKNHKNDNINQ